MYQIMAASRSRTAPPVSACLVRQGDRASRIPFFDFQQRDGISGHQQRFCSLRGMFLDVDGAIQPNGSLLATRIHVADPSAINGCSGPLMFVDKVVPTL